MDIASDVTVLEFPDVNYNFTSQTRFDLSNTALSTTWNATQTFDSTGRPSDSDHDN
jgi:hypothetical protein